MQVKTNNRLLYTDVVVLTEDICKYLTGDEYKVIQVLVKLQDKGELKQYVSAVACKINEEEYAIADIIKNEGKSIDEYKIDEKYCHITTYDANTNIIEDKKISFDENDNYPIKANFNQEYEAVDNFFKSFIRFRDCLINKNEIVKDDDIYQFYYSKTHSSKKEKKSIFDIIMKRRVRK